MESVAKPGLRSGHPTAWKFRHWSAPETKLGERRLLWHSGHGEFDRGPLESDLIIPTLFTDAEWQLNNLTDEGEADFVDVYFDDQAVRANLYVRGYDDTLVETDGLADLSGEVTGTGYAALNYERGTDWTASASVATGATKTFTAGGAWSAMTYLGIATVGSGTSGLLIAYVALSATRTLANTETLDITPTVTMS